MARIKIQAVIKFYVAYVFFATAFLYLLATRLNMFGGRATRKTANVDDKEQNKKGTAQNRYQGDEALRRKRNLLEEFEQIQQELTQNSEKVKYTDGLEDVFLSTLDKSSTKKYPERQRLYKEQELNPEGTRRIGKLWNLHHFNASLSSKIDEYRTFRDPRDPKCTESGRYSPNLPSTSVIVCFHNEEWSVLLRTVHSVLSQTDNHLLRELILIDDFSSLEHCKKPLDDYMSKFDKVRVIHTNERQGVAKARVLGASEANSEIVTYLDSHCEVTEGWIEPLLDTITRNYQTAVVPAIEVISKTTLEMTTTDCLDVQIGGFDWGLKVIWRDIPPNHRFNRHPCDNVISPVMNTGIFSTHKKFFKEIGYYDEDLELWGGENLALSFKIWMCGGRIEVAPCSHVGRIFGVDNPYTHASVKQYGDFTGKNLARVAEAWLDDRKPYFFEQYDGKLSQYRGINVSRELNLRLKLQCKTFQWYLDNVYPEKYIPGKALASGQITNMGSPRQCLDSNGGQINVPVQATDCHTLEGNQYWFLTSLGEIRTNQLCLDYQPSRRLVLYKCHLAGGNQYWKYDTTTRRIFHPKTNACLAMYPQNGALYMVDCDVGGIYATWTFQTIHTTPT